MRRDVVFHGLSPAGCRFYDKFSRFEPGDPVILRIGSLGPFHATVQWCADGIVGASFQNTLHGPIFDHICDFVAGR